VPEEPEEAEEMEDRQRRKRLTNLIPTMKLNRGGRHGIPKTKYCTVIAYRLER